MCPAAARVDGSTPARCGVICRVIANDRQRESGVGMDPAQLAQARVGGDGDTFLTIEKDPGSVQRLCCGTELPVLDDRGHYARAHYSYCPVWQAEKQRIAEGREQLAGGGLEPESVESYDSGHRGPVEMPAERRDPWASARRDLDVLAPGDVAVDAYGSRAAAG